MKCQESVRISPRKLRRCSVAVIKVVISVLFISTVLYISYTILKDISTISGPEDTGEQKRLAELSQDYRLHASLIRRNFMLPSSEPYRLDTPYPVAAHFLERAVRQISNLTARGVFVEVGAGDGEYRSPTLCLELEDSWTGLLVEPNPAAWRKLVSKNRKAYVSPTCVGIHNYSYVGKLFVQESWSGLLSDNDFKSKSPDWKKHILPLDCYPLYSHLLALGTTSVDFLVININGDETQVLETLPWEKVDIKMIALSFTTRGEMLRSLEVLASAGYTLYRHFMRKEEKFALFVKYPLIIRASQESGTTRFHFFQS